MLAGEHAVGPGDGLHQRVVAHRLVQIDGRAARRIEAGQPHGAHEYQPQRIGSVLELLIQPRLRLVHPLAVRLDVQAKLLHLLDLVLSRRDDHRHVGGGQHLQALLQGRLLRPREVVACQLRLHPGRLGLPVLAYLVMHPERGGLVDGHDHGLAHEATPQEVTDDVLRHRLQPVVAGDQVVLLSQDLLELLLLVDVEFSPVNQIVDVVVEVWVDQLKLRRAVFVEQRHRGPVLDRLLEVIDGDVVPEYLTGALLA